MSANGILRFVLGAAVLHLVATMPYPITLASVTASASLVSPDLIGLIAIAVLGSAMGQRRRWAHLAAFLLLVSILFRITQAQFLANYDRAFELADVNMLPGFFHWWLDDETDAVRAVKIGGLAVGLPLVQFLLAWAFVCVAGPARRTRGAILWSCGLQGLVVVGVLHASLAAAGTLWHASQLGALASEAWRTVKIAIDPAAVDDPIRAKIAVAAERLARAPGDLGRLGGADVHLLIIESYGRVALRQPELAARIKPLWQELGQDLHAAGFEALSGACCPAVSGGGSWLAHAELFSSLSVPENRTHALLLQSDLVPLPRHFANVGYHTVEVMPAMNEHWPEGAAFYGFQESVTQLELGYDGIVYHWGRMPDQFALHHLLERVVKPAKQPLFTAFVSVTSHMAWQMVPPYVSDWNIDADTFKAPARIAHPFGALDVPHNPRLVGAYGDSIEYALRAAVGYVCRLPRPSLVILLGDHQPPIAHSVRPPDHTKDVPIHVFANRPELLAPCRNIGMVPGCDVPEDMQPFQVAEFAHSFLTIYAK